MSNLESRFASFVYRAYFGFAYALWLWYCKHQLYHALAVVVERFEYVVALATDQAKTHYIPCPPEDKIKIPHMAAVVTTPFQEEVAPSNITASKKD